MQLANYGIGGIGRAWTLKNIDTFNVYAIFIMTTEGISYDAAIILSSYSFDGLKHYGLSALDCLNTSTTRVALVQDVNIKI